MKFHNIVRIEMVKAIVPAESIDTLINRGVTSANLYNTSLTILSLPSISISIDELESNMYGTNNTLDRSFATLQYDAQWYANAINNMGLNSLPSVGFYAMIPKFLKCQRIYSPTPLATLTKMSIQLNKPNGTLISSTLDTLDISGIFACALPPTSYTIATSYPSYYNSNDVDANSNSRYYYIETKKAFSINNFSVGDIIQIKGLNTSLISGNDMAKSDFKNFFENTIGIPILGYGSRTQFSSSEIVGGSYNQFNYAQYLIVEARYIDPTLNTPLNGTVLVNPFGDSSTTGQALEDAIRDVNFAGARLINTTKQTQLTFRIITRDMDSSTRMRPNNA